ncbi:MAG: tRNA lysidine(34) synthetase TilS [Steroidobacteraceae bacterium]
MSTRKPEGFSPAWLDARLAQLLPRKRPQRLLVACSGGVDSIALLALAARLPRRRWQVRAMHVHHHLQAAADAAARLCRAECRRLGVPLRTVHLRLGPILGQSVEAVARDARYAAAARALRAGEVLLTAHHDDDQLETVLLQLLRGAGVEGLAAMPACAPFGRGWHARPLLGSTRAQVEAWARAEGLQWIEDASNADLRFDRNYLRADVLPRLRSRWPAAATVVARSAQHMADASELLAAIGDADRADAAVGRALDVASLVALSPARQRNLLRRWIGAEGLRVPDARRLEQIRTALVLARTDAQPEVSWSGGSVRRFRGRLYAVGLLPPVPLPPQRWSWRRQGWLAVGHGLGQLHLIEDVAGPLALAKLPAVLTVTLRAGGERLQLRPRGPHRPLKDVLREAGVLPWWRPRLPLVSAHGRLIAVADLWTDAAFHAGPRTRRRGRFEWRIADAASRAPR